MLKPLESDLFENSKELINGDTQIMELLAQTLILSGFGMYLCQGSYPASQGEHMISHTMEMAYSNLPQSYHGEQIGVTTLKMAQIIEEKLQSTPYLQQGYNEQDILEFFGNNTGKQCLDEYKEKILSSEKLDEVNHLISSKWSDISTQISEIFINNNKLYRSLKNSSAPTSYKDIGWKENYFKNAVKYAKYSRNRFTFLDL